MKRYLLDSGVASDFVNARGQVRSRVMESARAGNRIGIPTPVLAELVGGVLASQNPPNTCSGFGKKSPACDFGHSTKKQPSNMEGFILSLGLSDV